MTLALDVTCDLCKTPHAATGSKSGLPRSLRHEWPLVSSGALGGFAKREVTKGIELAWDCYWCPKSYSDLRVVRFDPDHRLVLVALSLLAQRAVCSSTYDTWMIQVHSS